MTLNDVPLSVIKRVSAKVAKAQAKGYKYREIKRVLDTEVRDAWARLRASGETITFTAHELGKYIALGQIERMKK